MPWKEWAVPAVIALLAGAGVWALLAASDGSDEAKGSDDEEGGLVWVFPKGPLAFAGTHHVLVVAPHGDGPQQEVPSTHFNVTPEIRWASAWIGLEQAEFHTINCFTTPCPQPEGPWVLRHPDNESVPTFGTKDHNATRLTFYAFLENGELYASSADDEDIARFNLSGDYIQIPDRVWYLGDAPEAPNGTVKPPVQLRPLMNEARGLLKGLPEDGVASLETDRFESLVGTLYLTVRIDELVQAP